MEYKFVDKLNEDTNIDWWKTSRIALNKVIQIYNDWQIEHDFDEAKAKPLLANIEHGKQTIGAQDGGSYYLEVLEEMEKFVRDVLERQRRRF